MCQKGSNHRRIGNGADDLADLIGFGLCQQKLLQSVDEPPCNRRQTIDLCLNLSVLFLLFVAVLFRV